MTNINATSSFDRGDQVIVKDHPELGVFTVVDISASSFGITNIKILRKIEKEDGRSISIRLTDLTDADIKLSKFQQVTY